MLALLKGGRAAVTASVSPVARAAAGRVQPTLAQTAASRSQPLVSSAAACQRVLSLHRRLLAVLQQQSRALLRFSVIQCEFVLIYRTRRTMQVSLSTRDTTCEVDTLGSEYTANCLPKIGKRFYVSLSTVVCIKSIWFY